MRGYGKNLTHPQPVLLLKDFRVYSANSMDFVDENWVAGPLRPEFGPQHIASAEGADLLGARNASASGSEILP
jgi:hypothetical protein